MPSWLYVCTYKDVDTTHCTVSLQLTLGAHAQRGLWSVCLCVRSHLTYGASVRPENAITYSAGNEGQNICGVFSETAPLQTPSVVRPYVQSAIFPAESTHAHYSITWWTEAV